MTTSTIEFAGLDFEHTMVAAVPELAAEWHTTPVPDPRLVVVNDELAVELGLEPTSLASPGGVAFLSGALSPTGSRPSAMVYAGHQFGNYNPRLGDGRALLLGEVITTDGRRVDVHLKGSGRTPFARGGDGKAALGPMLREFVVAEAMHALGIPTTRALAVATTGERIHRDGDDIGAVLTRVAASHLRVGTFEYAARLDDRDVLRRLADHAIDRHCPHAADDVQPYLALLDHVAEAQAALVARWMLVGFIHGVMNTDNMTISGETIDYGPCAFVDRYDPDAVFSSIDHAGRYRYAHQPSIARWNLARLAECLLPLMAGADDDIEPALAGAREVVDGFPARYDSHWEAGMRAKLGLTETRVDDRRLFDELLAAMQTGSLDYTSTFRRLAASLDDAGLLDPSLAGWVTAWHERLAAEDRSTTDVIADMNAVNPVYVPRNHLVEAALAAATERDLGPFADLLAAVTDPFVERDGLTDYARPAPIEFTAGYQTFCGT